MRITFENYPDAKEYQSALIINSDKRWDETLYFTFYTPHGEEEETLFAGRYKAGVHQRKKPCEAVWIFDFHRWDEAVLKQALELELPPVDFAAPLDELLSEALQQLSSNSGDFSYTVKVKK